MSLSQPLSKVPDEELLSVFVPKGTACELVSHYGSVPEILLNSYPEELTRMRGIGPIKARQLKAVCEMARRIYHVAVKPDGAIRTPQDVFDRMRDMQHLPVEQFQVLLLNTKNGIIGEEMVSQGTVNATIVGPREVFSKAVRRMASSVILVHNHPSGESTPSAEDIALTKRIADAGRIMDIAVLDHVIVGKGEYASFKEKGLL